MPLLRLLVVAVAVPGLLVFAIVSMALAHGGEIELIVESLQRPDDSFGYGMVLTLEDGDLVEDARSSSGARPETGPAMWRTPKKRYREPTADLALDGDGVWRVEVGIDHDDGSGSVAFDEIVPAPRGVGVPVVRVDTVDPNRQRSVVAEDSAIFGSLEPAEQTLSADTPYDVRVEALVHSETTPLEIEYGVLASTVSGSGDGTTVVVTAESDRGTVVEPVTLEPAGTPEIFRGTVVFPEADRWAVTATVTADGTPSGFRFGENLPWPHFTAEAGKPKVKLSTADPTIEGQLLTIETSPIFGTETAASTTTPSTSIETETSSPNSRGDTAAEQPRPPEVDLPSTASELRRQVVLRWLHVAAIGTWIGAAALFVFWRAAWWVALVAVVGMLAALGTGLGLVLWGAPLVYPGLFRWQDLAERVYGPPYQFGSSSRCSEWLWPSQGRSRSSPRKLGRWLGSSVAESSSPWRQSSR